MPNEPQFVTCHCQHCDGHIEFDGSDFQKGETRSVECPFCKLETKIFMPVQSNEPKPSPIAATPPKPNPPATKSSSSQKELFSIKITSRSAAVFFAITTFCLASILVWEHLPNRSNPVSGNQPVSQHKILGSDTIAVWWGGDINRVRLDEANFERNGGVFYVRLKNTGRLVGQVSGAEAEKVQAYLSGN